MSPLQKIFSDVFKFTPEEAAKNLSMDDITNWDSLTHMDLISSIEANFSIQLSGDEIAEMTSLHAIERIINEHTN